MAKQKEELFVEEVENRGAWSFSKYIKSIATYKWWVIGATVVGAVVGFLSFKFFLNPSIGKLKTTYQYNLAGEYEDNDTIRFINGATFSSYDLTNAENLKKVKDSKPDRFYRVDVDKIVENEGISIIKNTEVIQTSEEGKTDPIINITYTLEAKVNCFPSDEIGKEFIFDLINLPKILSTEAINGYNVEYTIPDSFPSLSFDLQISQLEKQYNAEVRTLSTLSKMFGGSAAIDDKGTKLYEAVNAFNSRYYTAGSQVFHKALRGNLYKYNYVNYEVGKEDEKVEEIKLASAANIETFERETLQVKVYEDILSQLTGIQSVQTDNEELLEQIFEYSELISDLKMDLFNLERELNNNGYFIDKDTSSETYGKFVFDTSCVDCTIYKLQHPTTDWQEACVAFATELGNYRAKLAEDNPKTSAALRYTYSNFKNRVNVLEGGFVARKGGVSDFIGLAVGLVLGFIVSSLITTTLLTYKETAEYEKKEKAEK